jgi:formamidopyrimidine-DNA glycosylase
MPELPDLEAYVAAVRERVVGDRLGSVELASPFVLRTVEPPIRALVGEQVEAVRRSGKRIVLAFGDDLALAIHLMIAGRLHWTDAGAKSRGRRGTTLASFSFPRGTLTLTEAGTQRRAAIHVVRGAEALASLARAGIEPLTADAAAFAEALTRENHTLKRALTDPDLISGIGNAYSDEILHEARLSPTKLTQRLTPPEIARLREATRAVLERWIARLELERAGDFPEGVTAFRPEFAVHGRHRAPCPTCGAPIQRIVRGDHETNYCPRCQTGGQILSDRSLARLLKEDWPRSLDELERKPGFGARIPTTARR